MNNVYPLKRDEQEYDPGMVAALTKRRYPGLEVGDRVIRPMSGIGAKQVMRPGVVIYIHPKRRYHLVAFENGCRECYKGACKTYCADEEYKLR